MKLLTSSLLSTLTFYFLSQNVILTNGQLLSFDDLSFDLSESDNIDCLSLNNNAYDGKFLFENGRAAAYFQIRDELINFEYFGWQLYWIGISQSSLVCHNI